MNTDITLHALKRNIEDNLNALRTSKLSDEHAIELCMQIAGLKRQIDKRIEKNAKMFT